jgi:uncharacterized protein (DUF1330 family)
MAMPAGSEQSSVREDTMKTKYKLAIALVAGAALGGGAIQQLQAQMKPPTYVVVAIRKITDAEAYKAILEKAPAAAMAAGGNFAIRTDKITSLDGTPPARFVLIKFDSVEQAQAWHNSAAQKEVDAIRAKSTDSLAFIVEGGGQVATDQTERRRSKCVLLQRLPLLAASLYKLDVTLWHIASLSAAQRQVRS